MDEIQVGSTAIQVVDVMEMQGSHHLDDAWLKKHQEGVSTVQGGDSHTDRIIPMGRNDGFVTMADTIIENDPALYQILEKHVSYVMGAGIAACRPIINDKGERELREVRYAPFDDWYADERIKYEEFLTQGLTNYFHYGNAYLEYTRTANGAIYDYQSIDQHYIRALHMRKTERNVRRYKVKGSGESWRDGSVINAFDYGQPDRYDNFVLHCKAFLPGRNAYSYPLWWPARKMIELKVRLIEFLNSCIKNGWHAKFVMTIHPEFYQGEKDDKKRKQMRREFVTKLNAVLQGEYNAGRVIAVDLVQSEVNKLGGGDLKPYIKIEPIEGNDMDKSLNVILDKLFTNTPSVFGLDPALSGVETNKNFAGGSELKYKYLLHEAVNTRKPRQLIMKDLELRKKMNVWDTGVEYKIRRLELMNLSDDKTGNKVAVSE